MSIDLINDISAKNKLLETAVREFGGRGRSHAQAERDYRIALSQKILEERDKGTPVTIISDVCRGSASIAKLKFERDCAEVSYKAAIEAINMYKLQIRLLEAQVEREWGQARRS